MRYRQDTGNTKGSFFIGNPLLSRNFLFGLENGTIVHPSRLVAPDVMVFGPSDPLHLFAKLHVRLRGFLLTLREYRSSACRSRKNNTEARTGFSGDCAHHFDPAPKLIRYPFNHP